MRMLAIIVAGLALAGASRAAEMQRHGFVWETWLADTFFGGYRQPLYTQKWDIPAEANAAHGGIPANPKFTKHRAPVDLGDAMRQFDIDEPFLLIIGYWIQDGNRKRIVSVVAARVEPAQWRSLWGDITRADLDRLDAAIKDRSIGHLEARRRAQAIKSRPPFTTAAITVNPKIDSRTQRRLQCSLSFEKVFTHLAPGASRRTAEAPELWGVRVPGPFYSPPRLSEPAEPDSPDRPQDSMPGNPR